MAPRSVASRYRCERDTSRVKRRPRWEADYMSEQSTDQKKLADAAQPLFATLDDQQKKALHRKPDSHQQQAGRQIENWFPKRRKQLPVARRQPLLVTRATGTLPAAGPL
jgi:hypothetical protein